MINTQDSNPGERLSEIMSWPENPEHHDQKNIKIPLSPVKSHQHQHPMKLKGMARTKYVRKKVNGTGKNDSKLKLHHSPELLGDYGCKTVPGAMKQPKVWIQEPGLCHNWHSCGSNRKELWWWSTLWCSNNPKQAIYNQSYLCTLLPGQHERTGHKNCTRYKGQKHLYERRP